MCEELRVDEVEFRGIDFILHLEIPPKEYRYAKHYPVLEVFRGEKEVVDVVHFLPCARIITPKPTTARVSPTSIQGKRRVSKSSSVWW
jgi:hypothetical protein